MRRVIAAVLVTVAASCSFAGDAPAARLAAPGATRGGSITIGIGSPASIDPANAFEQWGVLVASLICDPLIQIDPVTGELKPAIAESWVVANGGTSITLKLRKGVRFHDGSAMSADDVAFQLSRVASQEGASNLAELLRPVAGFAAFHGDEEARNPDQLATFQGVRAIGTHALQISLDRPRGDFLRVLTHPLSTPVPRALVTKDSAAFEAQPVCTGPYKLTGPWRAGDPSIELVRAPEYYGANLGFTRGGSGYADRITLTVNAASGDAVVAPKATAGITGPTPYLEYIGLPVGTAPFDRREVRVALSMAIDRSVIARDVYAGIRTPALSYLPPATGTLYRRTACGSAAPERANVAGARAVLAAARVTLPAITLSYNPDFQNRALVEAVAAQWRAAFGVPVRLVAVPWERYVAQAADARAQRGPFRMGWRPRYPGPDAMLAPLFSADAVGRDNLTLFTDPRFDRALERQARRATNEDDLREAYQRLEDIACEQMPLIPVVFGGMRYRVQTARIASAAGSFTDIASGALILRELYVKA